MPTCMYKGCSAIGENYPVLVIPERDGGRPSRSVMNLPICDQHRPLVRAPQLIGDDAWAKICEAHTRQGKLAPQRSRVKLIWSRSLPGEMLERSKFTHPEAYCLMQYQDTDGSIEVIWNSRDGVTPFCVASRRGTMSQHVHFNEDRYAPDHQPKLGDRIWVDMSMERARAAAVEKVEWYWEHAEYPMKDSYPSKAAAVEAMTTDFYGEGHEPNLLEITEEELHRRARTRAEDHMRELADIIRSYLPQSLSFTLVFANISGDDAPSHLGDMDDAVASTHLRAVADKIDRAPKEKAP